MCSFFLSGYFEMKEADCFLDVLACCAIQACSEDGKILLRRGKLQEFELRKYFSCAHVPPNRLQSYMHTWNRKPD